MKAGLKETCNARCGCVMQGVAMMGGGVDAPCSKGECVTLEVATVVPQYKEQGANACRGWLCIVWGGCGNAGG